MTPVVAVILQDEVILECVGRALGNRGMRPILWHGSSGAHAFIARRRPNLVILSAPLENREAATRLLEELCWDPGTREIPVIIDVKPLNGRGSKETSMIEGRTSPAACDFDYLLQLVDAALNDFCPPKESMASARTEAG